MNLTGEILRPVSNPLISTSACFRPGTLWPDTNGVHINAHGGGVLYDDGVYYWFGEHKIAGPAGNAAHVGVSVYSSTDLYRWDDRGVALAVSDDARSPITRGCVLERPKVVRHPRTGRFVMWFHLELKDHGYGAALIGVAIADQATGPYRFVRAFRPNAGRWPANLPAWSRQPLTEDEMARLKAMALFGGPVPDYPSDLLVRRDFAGGQMSRDQTLFVDPVSGDAFHFHASEENGTLHVSRLSDDWLDTSGEYTRNFVGRFHEAPAPFYHGGKYWLITSDCTGWDPNPARLSVADSPLGPWTELGNPCRGSREEVATTFGAQSTFVLPLPDKPGAFIFMADRWRPNNAIDGRYIWLPVQFDPDGTPYLRWFDEMGSGLLLKPPAVRKTRSTLVIAGQGVHW